MHVSVDSQQFEQDNINYIIEPENEDILNSSTSTVESVDSYLVQDNVTVDSQINISEEDGFQYLAGWIAKKFKNEFPELCSLTKNNTEHQYILPNWLDHLSFGGLINPSEKWMEVVHFIEKKFNKYNGKLKLNNKPKISTKLTNKICKTQTVFPKKVIKAYILQRIFIRIKYLNLKIKQTQFNKSLKRKCHSKDVEGLKISKKLKKILT